MKDLGSTSHKRIVLFDYITMLTDIHMREYGIDTRDNAYSMIKMMFEMISTIVQGQEDDVSSDDE